ncbi:hypothetical protein BT63DRAFT_423695 [Microthyrium microscopicum]|uniref:F-box domain-containing protein n=1 Tax=Microthyrium microscopicum TaxID=703497 RepID=A0A6A6UIW9_9PEZI|nr:hypothetical protein BT63DRAFT_423695 [Microthyrium microscopicum]
MSNATLEGLPTEIRLMIFRELLISSSELPHCVGPSTDVSWYPHASHRPKGGSSRTMHPEILATCRWYHEEAKQILYSENSFLLSTRWLEPSIHDYFDRKTLSRIPKALESSSLCHITHLVFDSWTLAKAFVAELDHVPQEQEWKKLPEKFPGVTSVTCIVAMTEEPGLLIETDKDSDYYSISNCWRATVTAFRKRQPPLKHLRYSFQLPPNGRNPLNLKDSYLYSSWNTPRSSSPGNYQAWLGPRPHKLMEAVRGNNNQALSTTSDAKNSHTVHPDAKFHLPLTFTLHQHRMRLVRKWLARKWVGSLMKYNPATGMHERPINYWTDCDPEELNCWDYTFQTYASFQHLPQVRVDISLTSTPSTQAKCEVIGEWGHMSRMEDLELTEPGTI